MNILVACYNLELDTSQKRNRKDWKTPEKDRQKIVEFFEKYAPDVLKYKTAEEIKKAFKENPTLDGLEVLGTLGMYEQQWEASWFETINSWIFYGDYKLIRNVVDDYLSERKLSKGAWARIIGLGESIKPELLVGNKETKEVFSLTSFPNKIINWHQYIPLKGRSIGERWGLGVGYLVGMLYDEIFAFLSGDFEIHFCKAEGCNKVFRPAPQGSEQKYCSARCRNRTWARKNR